MRVVFTVIALLCIPMVLGLGISHEYLANKEILLSPGQNYLFKLTVQNDQEDQVTVNVSLESDVATIVGGGIVTIPAKTYDEFVYFNVTAPRDAAINETFPIKYLVAPVDKGEGQVPFAVKYERVISVRIIDGGVVVHGTPDDTNQVLQERPSLYRQVIIWPVAILLLAGILILLWRKSDVIAQKIRKKSTSDGTVAKEMATDITPTEESTTQLTPRHEIVAQTSENIPAVVEKESAKSKLSSSKEQHREPETPTVVEKPTPAEEQPVKQQPTVSHASIVRARPEHTFNLDNGKKLSTLHELVHELKTDPDVCRKHIVPENHFAVWIRKELQLLELSEKVGEQTTINGVIGVLNDAIA